MSEPLRIGVAGCGLIAQVVHLKLLAEMTDRFSVRALADPSATVRTALGRRYQVRDLFADHRAMLNDVGLDAVLVASPNGSHAEVVLDALASGLHVLVEKPLCIALADADRIVAARDREARVVQVGYMKRFDPAYDALLEDLPSGPAELRFIESATHDPGLARFFAPRDVVAATDVPSKEATHLRCLTLEQVVQAVGTTRSDLARTFSECFLGALIHDVNLVHGALERMGVTESADVLSAGWHADGGLASALVELEGGVRWSMVWLSLARLHSFGERIRLYAVDAIRTLSLPAPYLRNAAATYVSERGDDEARRRFVLGSHRESYERQLEHFHDCVTGDVLCRTPPEQARKDIDLLTRAFREVVERVEAR